MPYIPPFKYSFDEEDTEFVSRSISELLLSGRFLTLGQHNEAFEELFRESHEARFAVSVSSGTAALEILLRAAEVTGRKVIVPSNTFGATVVAVLRAGGQPLLAECGNDLSLDPTHVESLLSPEVAAVVVVHIGGFISSTMPHLCAICERHGIPLIEDAAHATGSVLAGKPAGTWGLGGAFSFFSTKVVTCGEGGMVVTQDARVRNIARLLRDHAKRADSGMDVVGYNWRLSELQALLGIVQMKKLPHILTARRLVAERYISSLRGLPHIFSVNAAKDSNPNYYKQIIFLPPSLREQVRQRLRTDFDVSLGGEVYAIPCHLQPAFKAYGEGAFLRTERLCAGHICPPIYPTMSANESQYACNALRTVLSDAIEIWEKNSEDQREALA